MPLLLMAGWRQGPKDFTMYLQSVAEISGVLRKKTLRETWGELHSLKALLYPVFQEGRRCKNELFYSKSYFSLHVKAAEAHRVVSQT